MVDENTVRETLSHSVTLPERKNPPGFGLLKGRDSLDGFGFVDVATLNLKADNESTDLPSVGVGVNYQFCRLLSVRAAYDCQLKYLDQLDRQGPCARERESEFLMM